MGGALGHIGASLASATKGLNNISPIMQQALSQIAQSGDQRAAFNAILLATAANATKKPNFNLEVEINDLWIRLGNLRSTAPIPTGGAFAQVGQVTAQLSSILSQAVGNIDAAVVNIAKTVK